MDVDRIYYWQCERCGMQFVVPEEGLSIPPPPCGFCGGHCITGSMATIVAGPLEDIRRDRP